MDRKKCPYCGEEIAITAKKCRFCGEWLPNESSTASQQSSVQNPVAREVVAPQQASLTDPAPQPPAQPSVQSAPQITPAQAAPAEPEQNGYVVKEENEDGSLLSFFRAYFINPYIRRYADFSGFTTRKSFWLTYVATVVLSAGLAGLILLLSSFGMAGLIFGGIIAGLIGLALIVPQLALCVRRLRDVGKNPWMILLGFIPVVGAIILLIFYCLPSKYQDTEDEGRWQISDWIVSSVCTVLLIVGTVLGLKSLSPFAPGSSYDWEESEIDEVLPVEEVENTEYEWVSSDEEVSVTARGGNANSLADLDENIDPTFFGYELTTYRIGSDSKMEELFWETGSTNVPIIASGAIGSNIITMQGWLAEDGSIHGRYHNENGINLDFNGYIRPDNSLYIQLGHDGEKSDWILHPVDSELGNGYARYEGKWGKSQKDSYVTF